MSTTQEERLRAVPDEEAPEVPEVPEGGDPEDGTAGAQPLDAVLETTEEPAPKPPMQEPLPGDWGGISNAFGGREAESSEIRLLGGKMPLDGSFAKGTVLDLHVRVKVTGVLGQDLVDGWGTEQATVRRHFARMISVRRIEPTAEAA